MNTPIVGRIYHVVDKTTGEVVKVGSTIRRLSTRWIKYDKKKYSNHFLLLFREIKSNELDWYEKENPYCPFLWHLAAAEHIEICRANTFDKTHLSNRVSPLEQRFRGFDGSIPGRIQGRINRSIPGRMSSIGRIGGRSMAQKKIGMFADENLGKGGRTNVKSGHLARISSAGGKVGGPVVTHKIWHVKRGIINPNCHLCVERKEDGGTIQHSEVGSS